MPQLRHFTFTTGVGGLAGDMGANRPSTCSIVKSGGAGPLAGGALAAER